MGLLKELGNIGLGLSTYMNTRNAMDDREYQMRLRADQEELMRAKMEEFRRDQEYQAGLRDDVARFLPGGADSIKAIAAQAGASADPEDPTPGLDAALRRATAGMPEAANMPGLYAAQKERALKAGKAKDADEIDARAAKWKEEGFSQLADDLDRGVPLKDALAEANKKGVIRFDPEASQDFGGGKYGFVTPDGKQAFASIDELRMAGMSPKEKIAARRLAEGEDRKNKQLDAQIKYLNDKVDERRESAKLAAEARKEAALAAERARVAVASLRPPGKPDKNAGMEDAPLKDATDSFKKLYSEAMSEFNKDPMNRDMPADKKRSYFAEMEKQIKDQIRTGFQSDFRVAEKDGKYKVYDPVEGALIFDNLGAAQQYLKGVGSKLQVRSPAAPPAPARLPGLSDRGPGELGLSPRNVPVDLFPPPQVVQMPTSGVIEMGGGPTQQGSQLAMARQALQAMMRQPPPSNPAEMNAYMQKRSELQALIASLEQQR